MNLLYLTILFPLFGFLLLAFSQGSWSKNITALVGSGSVGLAALTTVWLIFNFFSMHNSKTFIFTQTLWHWIKTDNFQIPVTLSLDGLSLTMLSIITGIGFLVHLYATWYMHDAKEGYARFFAYTNLFIANMILLVLADNLLTIYFAWEGVGLCSYLLIGFYFTDLKHNIAAIKAFIMTRLGDIFLLFALFILYNQFNTLNFHQLTVLVSQKLMVGDPIITWITLMLLIGSIGKSAQFPLQTWLSDAMVGPTPVSALIHSATMVTAGVYLITRTHGLFLMAPDVLYLVGIIGVITLLLGSCAALVQTDIKKILAYSTMSQIGYMFLSLGIQNWNAAIFHLMTHACFKALLFLSSGSIIFACHHEQNIFKMGGLRQSIPFIYTCFLVGGASLSALPLITAGFYSKDEILWSALVNGHNILLCAGLIGTLLTSIYTFRMIFIIFHGNLKIKVHLYHRSTNHYLPLICLLILSTCIGSIITPPLSGVLPNNISHDGRIMLELTSGILTMFGIMIATVLWFFKHPILNDITASAPGRFFSIWWLNAWGFDWLYKQIFIKPYLAIARFLEKDPLNALISIPVVKLVNLVSYVLTLSINGQLRWYVASMFLGAVIIITSLILL